MDSFPTTIRTPDQRLRVFVSSTLKELAPERKAARAAIERLHLAPVMFELGARPHPPRELYRAYLDQSDVFVGIYWERYGWVAPEESISGLEDEYVLAPAALPKLMYIKDPADARESRLVDLLDRVRSDDTASFKYFSDAAELGELLEADLATLLAERFDQSRAFVRGGRASVEPAAAASGPLTAMTPDAAATPPGGAPAPLSPADLPVPLTALIGRQHEVDDVERMLRRPGTRLVTLTGPGGIGKSRLAIEVADRLAPDYPGGTAFVDLSSVHEPDLVLGAIAQTLGVRDTGDAPIGDKLLTALRGRRMLLVLDNFEQVVGAGPAIVHLLTSSPGLTVVVTSRVLLRISGEYAYEVGPLGLPRSADYSDLDAITRIASVALFVERVHAVRPDFEVGPDNVAAVVRICAALDGVPLALELAAARVRLLTPAAMLERLDRQLPLLVGGARDLPARQRTLRSTIEWSVDLLGADERRLLGCLGVFDGGFSLEAAEAVTGPSGADAASDTLAVLATLVDSSLVSQHDSGDRSRFSLLATVREFALEQLADDALLDDMRERHASYFIGVGVAAELDLEGPKQRRLMQELADDHDNLRSVARYLLDRGEWDRVASFAWTLYVYWWVDGHLGEVRGWMDEVLAAGDLSDRARAIALYFTRAITFWQDPDGTVVQGLTESADLFHREGEPAGEALALVSLALAVLAAAEPDAARADDALETSLGLFRESGDVWGEALVLVTLGRVALLQQKVHAALNRFDESLELTRRQGDELGETIALNHLGWAQLLLGEPAKANADFAENLAISTRLGHDDGVAYGLEGMVAVAAMLGDARRAGLLLGASQTLRRRAGLYNAPVFSFHQPLVDRMLAGAGAGESPAAPAAPAPPAESGAQPGDTAVVFESALAEGRALTPEAAVAVALGEGVPAREGQGGE
ncbi:DUF4062 domain-containing protein [Herbiconiux daphne]|uniref:DUF4062 domain-containing protein n=1 Tax=Herbiconiux daphne TaxID=2970914 RepID=A0ABT2H648_9MICO|nr:DUF4062 domain-containing protein [Herbiconiux daphne]MCS5735430.1 DUF4062 domain-containing protein [Herbiconiux daphne]